MDVKAVTFGIILFLCTNCAISQIITGVCDDDTWHPYNGACYKFVNTAMITAGQAQEECNHLGDAKLIRISSTAEIHWLTGLMKSTYPSSGMWTSLNDLPKTSLISDTPVLGTTHWQWGETMYADMSLISWNQSPVNDGVSNCAGVNILGTISDLDCNSRQGFICRYTRQSNEVNCPVTMLSFEEACFYISDSKDPAMVKSWDEARTYCENMAAGATLLVVKSTKETDFLQSHLPYVAKSTTVYWLGLKYTNNQWSWYTGAPGDAISLLRWQKEPNNIAGIENCVVLRMNGKFSDRDCSAKQNYVCVKPQYGADVNASDNYGCGSWIRAGQTCVGVSTVKKSWAEARQYCQNYNADLIKVDSLDKMSWLAYQTFYGKLNGIFWTGLNDRAQEGKYVWADGTPVEDIYLNWNREPNGYMGMEDCGLITSLGQYNDMSCFERAAAICKLYHRQSMDYGCPGDYWKQYNDYCYLFTAYSSEDKLFMRAEAQDFCSTFADYQTGKVGELLSVETTDERDWLKSQVTSMPNNSYGWWTSLNDVGTEGEWRFNSGPLLDPSLIEWSGEPSNKPEDDCGFMNYGGVYHQRECTLVIPFICEKLATGVTLSLGHDVRSGTAAIRSELSLYIVVSLLLYLATKLQIVDV